MIKKSLETSKSEYNLLHKKDGFGEEEEYYDVLGTMLKGKKSVDIGCGYGYIERYSPETVAVDFSEEALKVAKKNGAKVTVKASAEKLPFKNNEFDVSLSLGVLEHCFDQKKAIREMTRVSKIQIIVPHAKLPYGLEYVRKPINKLFGLKDQPIENPLSLHTVEKYLNENSCRVIVRGIWNYVDLRWLWKKLPYGFLKFPSHYFIISIKSNNIERAFLGEKKV